MANRTAPSLSWRVSLLSSYGISLLLYAAIVAVGVGCSLNNESIRFVLLLFATFGMFMWLKLKLWGDIHWPEFCLLFGLCFSYLVLTVSATAYPTGDIREIYFDKTMQITQLPGDLLIPYNFSRFVVEKIDPASRDVVPGWHSSERGPLAGLIHACMMMLANAQEKESIEIRGGWGETSLGVFYIYQVLLVFLNLLSLRAVYLICANFAGNRAAVYAVLMLLTTCFYFTNVAFPWPKLLMAYYIVTAIALWQVKGPALLTGAFLAGGMLSHDSAVFPIIIFFVAPVIVFLSARGQQKRKLLKEEVTCGFMCLLGLGVVLSPWVIYKYGWLPTSSRLFYFHVFCLREDNLNNLSLLTACREYLEKNTFQQIISYRLENLLYPFDPLPVIEAIQRADGKTVTLLETLAPLTVSRFITAVGLPLLLLIGIAHPKTASAVELNWTIPYLIIGFGSLFVLTALLGCAPETGLHLWAYVALLSLMMLLGILLDRGGTWSSLVVASGIAVNFLLCMRFIYLDSFLQSGLLASSTYFLGQAIAAVLIILFLLLLMGYAKDEG